MTSISNKDETTLGSVLETARQEASLTLRRLAALSGIPMSTVNRLLKDEVERPSPAHLQHLAKVLELNPADVFLLAGLSLPSEAPSLEVMLRTEYGLPPEAIAEAKRDLGRIIEKYDGGAQTGRQH